VSRYSTRGGTSANTLRSTMPKRASLRKRSFSTLPVSPSTLRSIAPGRATPLRTSETAPAALSLHGDYNMTE
jgi:hypothetical protein